MDEPIILQPITVTTPPAQQPAGELIRVTPDGTTTIFGFEVGAYEPFYRACLRTAVQGNKIGVFKVRETYTERPNDSIIQFYHHPKWVEFRADGTVSCDRGRYGGEPRSQEIAVKAFGDLCQWADTLLDSVDPFADSKGRPIVLGDIIQHAVFGHGTVVLLKPGEGLGASVQIQFERPVGLKELSLAFARGKLTVIPQEKTNG